MRCGVTNETGYRNLSAWSDRPCARRYPGPPRRSQASHGHLSRPHGGARHGRLTLRLILFLKRYRMGCPDPPNGRQERAPVQSTALAPLANLADDARRSLRAEQHVASLPAAFAAVSGPWRRRGRRYELPFLLACIEHRLVRRRERLGLGVSVEPPLRPTGVA